jgi:hypothetical protein
MWATSVISAIPARSKLSSIGRKFAQSGHPAPRQGFFMFLIYRLLNIDKGLPPHEKNLLS